MPVISNHGKVLRKAPCFVHSKLLIGELISLVFGGIVQNARYVHLKINKCSFELKIPDILSFVPLLSQKGYF